MEPLNKKTRTGMFFKFLALFIIGILIVLVPFYFLIRLPQKQETITTNEYNTLDKQLKFQKDVFSIQMDSARSMLERFNKPGIDIDKLNADLGFLLSTMEKSIESDTSWANHMYRNILSTYLDLKKSRNSTISSGGEVEKLREQLADAQAELDKCNRDLDKCGKDLKEAQASGGGSKKPKDSLEH